MKKTFSFCILAAAALLVSCEPQNAEQDVSLQIITPELGLTFSADGGPGELSFELANPREDGKVNVELQEGVDWISVGDVVDFGLSGKVAFEVSPFEAVEERHADITVVYEYDGGQKVSATATITQKAFDYDYSLVAEAGRIEYLGDNDYDDGLYDYQLLLGTPEAEQGAPNTLVYKLDIWSVTKTEDRMIEPGTYRFGERTDASADGGIIATDTWYQTARFQYDADGNESDCELLVEGELVVERNGNEYTITGKFIDAKTYTHYVSYKGELALEDLSHYSDFEEDTELDLTGMQADVWYWGDIFGSGSLWTFMLYAGESAGIGSQVMTLQVTTAIGASFEDGFAGEFTPDPSGKVEWTYTPGNLDYEGYASGAWYMNIADITEDGDFVPGSPMAPLEGGTVVLREYDETSFEIEFRDVTDDNDNKVTVSAIVPYAAEDMSFAPAKIGKMTVSPYLPGNMKTTGTN